MCWLHSTGGLSSLSGGVCYYTIAQHTTTFLTNCTRVTVCVLHCVDIIIWCVPARSTCTCDNECIHPCTRVYSLYVHHVLLSHCTCMRVLCIVVWCVPAVLYIANPWIHRYYSVRVYTHNSMHYNAQCMQKACTHSSHDDEQMIMPLVSKVCVCIRVYVYANER